MITRKLDPTTLYGSDVTTDTSPISKLNGCNNIFLILFRRTQQSNLLRDLLTDVPSDLGTILETGTQADKFSATTAWGKKPKNIYREQEIAERKEEEKEDRKRRIMKKK